MFLIGVLDDLKDLKPIVKVGLFLIIYLILVNFDNDYLLEKIYIETFHKNLNLGIYSYPISILCILLLINAINLIDGINGLAMMVFIIIYLFLHYFFNVPFNIFIFIFYLFVFFNIYKGKYFLGNSGSITIGALIAFSTIKGYNLSAINNSAEDIFILFLVPGIDMFRLFVVRIINKQNPFKADNKHLHHLLITKYPLKNILFFYFIIIVGSSYMAFNDILSELIIIFIIVFIYSILLFFLKNKNLNELINDK